VRLRDVVAGLTDQRAQVSRCRRRVHGRRPRDACVAHLLPSPEDAEGAGCWRGVVVGATMQATISCTTTLTALRKMT
jgi:hypothetical protein